MFDRTNRDLEPGDIILDLRGSTVGIVAGGQTPTGRIKITSWLQRNHSTKNYNLIKIPINLAIEILEQYKEDRRQYGGYWNKEQEIKYIAFMQKLQEQQ